MSETEIIEQMRGLPTEKKRGVLEKIWTEFGDELGWSDPDLTPQQADELDRRLAEFEKNPRDGIPWEQVETGLKKRFGSQA